MKKIFLSSVLFLGGILAASAVETPYSCDFSNGGEGFICYDQDGEVPSVTAQK